MRPDYLGAKTLRSTSGRIISGLNPKNRYNKMDMDLASGSKPVSVRPLRARIPFVSTSFAQNLWYYALLWPVWWLLGVEQLLLPFFVLYETGRFLIRSHWRIRFNTTIVLGLLLALWWLVPIIWVDREFLD